MIKCLSVFVSLQAYASGCDLVILASNFQRVQIIPGDNHGNIQVGCIDCSSENGKVRNLEMMFWTGGGGGGGDTDILRQTGMCCSNGSLFYKKSLNMGPVFLQRNP